MKPGLPVRFTVYAFPKETFHGEVGQVRLNAQTTQNVVTYTVVVLTDNSDRRLLPYLTANLQFEVEKRTGALQVPNAALRWRPRPSLIAPDAREAVASTADRSARWNKSSGHGGEGEKAAKERVERGRIWCIDGDYVRPVEVRIGLSDGVTTEVSGREVREGLEIALGEARVEQADSGDTTNPFAPKIFRRSANAPKGPQ
jgi:HlyD family secretion protein